MKNLNRRAVSLGLALLASIVGALPAWADTFPSKPIRIVVPFGAGGVADLTARTVAQKLSESLGQPVVIDNKPGAGGVGAGEAVAKADIMLDFQTSNRLDQIQRNADLYLAADRITEEFDFSLHVLDAPDNC